jgi:glycine/D-amino acid oxidase-like deaminating enzyme
MACGAAKLVADPITGRPPEIAIPGMTLERWRGPRRVAGP